ncbi:MAG: ABC transporter ATP-binding protein [Candidatus Heimdallarchaeota archaeon]
MILEVKNLTKAYQVGNQKILALNRLTYSFPLRRIHIVIGRSGSGKTTLLSLLSLLDTPTSGSIFLDNLSFEKLAPKSYASIWNNYFGFVFQEANLIGVKTAYHNIELPLLFRGIPRQVRNRLVTETAERLGIKEKLDQKAFRLSGGQKQRVAIARELIKSPVILFADEPTGNLDDTSSTKIVSELRRISEETGVTLIIATHDLRFRKLSSHILALEDGKIQSS